MIAKPSSEEFVSARANGMQEERPLPDYTTAARSASEESRISLADIYQSSAAARSSSKPGNAAARPAASAGNGPVRVPPQPSNPDADRLVRRH